MKEKYGLFTVDGPSHKDSRGRAYVHCTCECGKKKTLRLSDLTRTGYRQVVSCGCALMRSGVKTSSQALKIEKMLNQPNIGYKTDHNHYIGKDCVDIALVDYKVCIEYNSYYFHREKQDKTRQDRNKVQRLVRRGWKVLTIQGDREVPSMNVLLSAILSMLYGPSLASQNLAPKSKTLTLGDWVAAKEKQKNGTI